MRHILVNTEHGGSHIKPHFDRQKFCILLQASAIISILSFFKGIATTLAACPSAASSCMEIWTAPSCFGPHGIHIPFEVFMKNMASWVFRTGSKSTSLTCHCENRWNWPRDKLIIWIRWERFYKLCLHKRIYLNQKIPLSSKPSSQNHFQINCEEYPLSAPIHITKPQERHEKSLLSSQNTFKTTYLQKNFNTLNMCCRALRSGRGIYMRLSKRRRIACSLSIIMRNNHVMGATQ